MSLFKDNFAEISQKNPSKRREDKKQQIYLTGGDAAAAGADNDVITRRGDVRIMMFKTS